MEGTAGYVFQHPAKPRFCLRLTVAAAALLLAAACHRPAADAPPQVRLVSPADSTATAFIEITGLTRNELRALTRSPTDDSWQRVLSVTVKRDADAASGIAVAGRYVILDDALRFTPMFPFDPGRQYYVELDRSAIPGHTDGGRTTATVALPAPSASAPTFVTHVFPSGDVVPENQLRMYIHFSAPMGRRGALDHVKLLDDRGREVPDPFLPLEAEFWNAERTRYTVFFDPGRQKRGILPNRQMGPSLVAGKSYTLVVLRKWTDGHGKPLRETFTRRFRVGPPDLSPIDYVRWRITAPVAGTRAPLSVVFPEPLDHGLLMRAIGVRRDGEAVVGDVRVDGGEAHWTMTPADAWRPGRYELIALSILEDLAGNRIDRAFEVVSFDRAGANPEREVTTIPFVVPAPR
jgi:hypothetical protein